MARAAKSLDILLAEVDAYAPHRNKLSDGLRGDPAHAARASRHNPNDAGVICARDITHDPAHACDIHALARGLVARLAAGGSSNPSFEYVISARQVAKRRTGWVWEPYTGDNPHDKHAHFAVGRGPDAEPTPPYDDTTPWGIAPDQEDDVLTPPQAESLARIEKIADDNRWNATVLATIAKAVGALDKLDDEIIAGVLAGLDPKAIAAAIPADLAEQVADELAARLEG